MDMDLPQLKVSVELASDMSALSSTDHSELFATLYEHLVIVRAERTFAEELRPADPEDEFAAIVAAEGNQPLDYLFAARRSHARLMAAQHAGERDWISRHHTAAKKYLMLAAEALRQRARQNEISAKTVQSRPYAIRRPQHEAERIAEQLKHNGLMQEHRELLAKSGMTAEAIMTYQRKVTTTATAELGISVVELWQKMAETRRDLANALDKYAKDPRGASGPLSDTFVVGNPYDRDEWVHLFLRRAAIPPEWTLSLVEVEPTEAKSGRLQVAEAGREYKVRLPAKGHIKLASIVTPVGMVAENTTARWAVDGKIGYELLGGIVQELNVPAFLPDLELPPIAVPTAVADGPTGSPTATEPSPEQRPLPHILWLGAGVLLVTLVLVLLFRRRRTR
jgi:hypothetical protein